MWWMQLFKIKGDIFLLLKFQVKVHEVPGGTSSTGRSSNAVRFFNTHQLKVCGKLCCGRFLGKSRVARKRNK